MVYAGREAAAHRCPCCLPPGRPQRKTSEGGRQRRPHQGLLGPLFRFLWRLAHNADRARLLDHQRTHHPLSASLRCLGRSCRVIRVQRIPPIFCSRLLALDEFVSRTGCIPSDRPLCRWPCDCRDRRRTDESWEGNWGFEWGPWRPACRHPKVGITPTLGHRPAGGILDDSL